ncbi:MAG: hypothetical protein AB7N71_13120, partial [Phycisphaerae bacterium]
HLAIGAAPLHDFPRGLLFRYPSELVNPKLDQDNSLLPRLIVGVAVSAAIVVVIAATAFSPSAAVTSVIVDGETPSGVDGATVALRGIALQLHGPDNDEQYKTAIDEIAALGANSILLTAHGYMEHARANAIHIDMRKSPTPSQVESLIAHAQSRGLRVMLMPVVLLSHPRGSEWRGTIDPPDWDDWWKEYEQFVMFYVGIAKRARVESFIVGSELVSTEKFTDKWQRLIGNVRAALPECQLGYSANWDHYKPIEFWDRLDFVGMTSYYKLAKKDAPTVEEIVRSWQPIRDEITSWRAEIAKPLVLTEVGWCSQEGAAKAPWNYYQNMKATPAGLEEQRRLYEGFLQAWAGTPGLHGVMWWEWTTEAGGADDYGYSPKGKPAADVLRDWLREPEKSR